METVRSMCFVIIIDIQYLSNHSDKWHKLQIMFNVLLQNNEQSYIPHNKQ